MILRIWHAPVLDEKIEPFQAFMHETLFPALEATEACVGMTTAVDRAHEIPRVVAVSVWASRTELGAFTGTDTDGVIFEEAEAFLAGEPRVEHHEVLDHATWPGDR